MKTKKPPLRRLRSRKVGDSALAWQNDAGLASHVVSNHYQKDGLAMATDKHSSVPEGFKEIPGYGGRYFINESGDVWSVFKKGLMSIQTDATHPYPWLLLIRVDGKKRPTAVYRLMRITWMPSAPGEVGTGRGKWCVNHKDGNKLNSHIDNLEWVTNEQNLSHAWHTGLKNDFIGEARKNTIFTGDQVRQIRLRLILGEKVKSLAEEHNCSVSAIKNVQKYHSWKHQDWDLIKQMMQVCESKLLPAMLECIKDGRFYDFSHSKPDWKYEAK
jgi:hypothetical protein